MKDSLPNKYNHEKYDNLIMSWSCFGDFILIAQSMKTLIDSGVIKKGIIITHEKGLKGLLSADEKILLLYPTQNIKDFFLLLKISLQENIFILHDMPSHNRFSKEIRLVMSILLTKLRLKSNLVLMLDKQFKENITTRISKIFSNSNVTFDKTEQVHISQYMLNKLSEGNIIPKIVCEYKTAMSEEYFDIDPFGKNYIVINPFASSEDKSMSVSWYIDFLNKLVEITDQKVILIGSNKDRGKVSEIVSKTKNTINLCGATSFREVLFLLKNSKLMINVDSGPTHYGAMYNKPQIILWGENKNFAYMPIHNPNAVFIFGDKIIKSRDVYKNILDTDFKKYADADTVIKAYTNMSSALNK